MYLLTYAAVAETRQGGDIVGQAERMAADGKRSIHASRRVRSPRIQRPSPIHKPHRGLPTEPTEILFIGSQMLFFVIKDILYNM